jgi:hypothetical protein
MPSAKKRLPAISPRKIQSEITTFIGKRHDNKKSPHRSYVKAVSSNPFAALAQDDEDEAMQENSSLAYTSRQLGTSASDDADIDTTILEDVVNEEEEPEEAEESDDSDATPVTVNSRDI